MAKKRSFDENEVLGKITLHFWKHGYSATKVDQLAELTGLTKTSLYHAFGNKEAVFMKAVDFYVEYHLAHVSNYLDLNKSMSECIRNVLSSEFLEAESKLISYGCLMTNSILELSENEDHLYEYVTNKLEIGRTTLIAFFSHYVEQGKIVDNIKAEEICEMFITFRQGLKVQSRNTRPALAFQWAINAFILSLENLEIKS